MQSKHHILVLSSVAIVWLATVTAAAPATTDGSLSFLHALQEHGYGDMAVEYLKSLDAQADLPAEIRDVWDLEMSKSLKTAAADAFDAKEYDALMAESQQYLAKFIKEKPDHPEAMIAMASWGDFLTKRALELLRAAKNLEGKEKEKEQYEKLLADARAGLTDARDKFRQAEQKFQQRYAELPPPPKSTTRRADREAVELRERVAANLLESQFQLALIEYYLAQTYADPKSQQRVDSLKNAAKMFDAIYQPNRENITGVYAHMWHGKTAEELGDLQTALDIYDEVLARAPEPTERGPETGLEPLFTQVEYFRFLIIAQTKPKQFLPEAMVWLKAFRRWKNTDGYQGIALQVAKAALAEAEKLSPVEKNKVLSEVLTAVTDCSRVRSQYQQEFVMLRRDLLKARGKGGEVEVSGFDEAVVLGDGAVSNADWEGALAAYAKALKIAADTKLKAPDRIEAVREAMGRVRYMIARDLFNAGKLAECLDMTDKIVLDEDGKVKKHSAAAAQAAALGVTAALNIYVAAPEDQKPASLKRLIQVADFTVKNWPDRPEADDARIALGQAQLAVGKYREGIDIFDRVNPRSERYASAMYLAGINYWRLYLAEKSKPKGKIDKEQMAEDRQRTEDRLSKGLETFRKQWQSGEPMPKYMLETQLLLAEVYAEGNRPKEAAELYQPLVDMVKAEKQQSFDANTIRIFLGAVRAYSAINELAKAGEVSALLVEIGPDQPQINDVLLGFAKLLNVERQKADAAVTELEQTADAEKLAAAKQTQESIKNLLADTLVKLSQRQELGLGHMIFIGETLNTVDKTEEARQQFERIIQRAQSDPQFGAQAQKAMSLIRTELLKVLRKQENYAEALKQVEELIAANPRALEPLMEKGRILEAWAEKDPAKFKEAVDHWTKLRNMLQNMKKKPNEYYEVMYNVAKCLVREAEKSQDKNFALERAKMAEQVLKSPLILSPKLNGPDTVAKYKVLLNKAIVMQGRKPLPQWQSDDDAQ